MKNTNKKKALKGAMSIMLSAMLMMSATTAFALTASAADTATAAFALTASAADTATADQTDTATEFIYTNDEFGSISIQMNEDGTFTVTLPDSLMNMEDKYIVVTLNEDGTYTVEILDIEDVIVESDSDKAAADEAQALQTLSEDTADEFIYTNDEFGSISVQMNEDGTFTVTLPDSLMNMEDKYIVVTLNEDGTYTVEILDIEDAIVESDTDKATADETEKVEDQPTTIPSFGE